MDNRISLLKSLPPDTPVGRFQLGGLINAIEERNNLESIHDELTQIVGGSHGLSVKSGIIASVIGLIITFLIARKYLKLDTPDAYSGGQHFLPQAINFAIVIVIAIIFIFIGGSCLYMHNKTDDTKKNPLYFALGIAFAGAGGSIISHAAMGVMIPPVIRSMIQNTKSNGRI